MWLFEAFYPIRRALQGTCTEEPSAATKKMMAEHLKIRKQKHLEVFCSSHPSSVTSHIVTSHIITLFLGFTHVTVVALSNYFPPDNDGVSNLCVGPRKIPNSTQIN